MSQTAPQLVSRTDERFKLIAARLLVIAVVLAVAGWLLSTRYASIRSGTGSTGMVATKASMRTIVTSLKGFKADKGSYPANLQALVSDNYVERAIKDAWQRDFVYATPGLSGREFGLVSVGGDGVQGTADDVDWWSVEQE